MPTREQAERSIALVEAARERLKGVLTIDYVVPDYYARYPKACMGGWGRQNLNVTPSGKVLPCHAAEGIASLTFDNVKDRPLAEIWYHGAAFNAFRGTDWMEEPCRSCPRRFTDFGGCRCQAFAMLAEPGDRSGLLALAAPSAGRDRGPRGRRRAAPVRLPAARQCGARRRAGEPDPGRVRGPRSAAVGARPVGAIGVVGRLEVLPLLAAPPASRRPRRSAGTGREPLEQPRRIARPIELEVGLAQVLERAAVVRVELERLVVEHERAVVVAELARGEARRL